MRERGEEEIEAFLWCNCAQLTMWFLQGSDVVAAIEGEGEEEIEAFLWCICAPAVFSICNSRE